MKDSTKNTLKKVGYAVATAAMTASTFAPMAFAGNTGGSAKSIVSTFLGYVVDMFTCVGILLGVWAVAQLALSFKNEDADSKSKAMMMLIVAAILIGIKPLADTVVKSAGTSITIGNGFLDILPIM